AGAVGGLAAVLVAWLGTTGVIIGAVLAVAIIVGLCLYSRRNAVTPANAMSDVADACHGVEQPDVPSPTRRKTRMELLRALDRAERKAEEAEKAAARARKLKKKGGTESEIKAARKAAARAARKHAEAQQ